MKAFYKISLAIVTWFYQLRSQFPIGKQKSKPKSVLYLAAFFPGNAGYRWRVEKWAEILREEGYDVTISYALTEEEFYHLKATNPPLFYIKFLQRRFRQVKNALNFETVIVRREILVLNDYGDLFLEKFLLKRHSSVILDFDDDIAAAKRQPREVTNLYGKLLGENGNKFNESLQSYNRFIVASDYLKQRVLEENRSISKEDICFIPTCVDYDQVKPKFYPSNSSELTLGWIGSDNNYDQLFSILPVLEDLSDTYKFKLLIIGGSQPKNKTKINIEFSKWSLESEIDDLLKIDVGLMPLLKSDESLGKGGFKLIQYMGLGIVAVATPITINNEIVDQGINGYLAESNEEWTEILKSILNGDTNLNKMGERARQKITSEYSFEANKINYVKFIDRVRNSRNMV